MFTELKTWVKAHKQLVRFMALLALLVGYFIYLSLKFDLETGGWVAALTWSFFVLCTPIADAGFLLDFPIRLILGWRMVVTELLVWTIAISLNTATVYWAPETYNKTFLTDVFYHILTQPNPYWSIIFLCAIGTFLSLIWGDEVMDVATQKQKRTRRFWLQQAGMVAVYALVFWAYGKLLALLGIHLPV